MCVGLVSVGEGCAYTGTEVSTGPTAGGVLSGPCRSLVELLTVSVDVLSRVRCSKRAMWIVTVYLPVASRSRINMRRVPVEALS